jgi:hypothetical protein
MHVVVHPAETVETAPSAKISTTVNVFLVMLGKIVKMVRILEI